ncbi:MAG TPA: leucyl aminopeptidase [Aeromicrobium sp.]|nr:leucyl aminopeptidase [Aeromicrobium sp.]
MTAMVSISLSRVAPTAARTDVLVLGIRDPKSETGFAAAREAMGFTGEADQIVCFPAGDLARARLVVAVAVPADATAEQLRRVAGAGVRAAIGSKATSVALAFEPEDAEEIGALAEGALLGSYAFTTYKSKKNGKLRSISLLTPLARQSAATDAVKRASVIAEAVGQARDWVNTAPADLRPPTFADEIKAWAGDATRVTIWDERKLERERCGGILAVGAGSEVPPRLVQLTYRPAGAKKHLALVGKGITFDSGGLSIKTGAGMQTMKMDMAGAAAVVGAIGAIARLGLPIRVTAYACLAENMPSGSATRPGDILTMRSGATVEVLNTDAEGRLVLGDGLALAAEAKPDAIIDVATLTGACIVALGDRTAGVMSNDDALRSQLVEAASAAGESAWALPIPDEMQGKVKSSKVADLRQHNPKPAGGALFAAEFLRSFVGEVPWAHVDIAGPAFNEEGPYAYVPVGGTGFGVRSLVRLAAELADEG